MTDDIGTMSDSEELSRTVTLLGYERGVILRDEFEEYRSMHAAESVILRRYHDHGIRGVHNLMGLVDDGTLPE